MTASPDKAFSGSSSRREKNKKKAGKPLSIQQQRAIGKKKAALKVNKDIVAASLAGVTSALRRFSVDLHLHAVGRGEGFNDRLVRFRLHDEQRALLTAQSRGALRSAGQFRRVLALAAQ